MIKGIDGNGSPYIAWDQTGSTKRAWVQSRTGETDWAKTGRYLNVARTDTLEGGPRGNATDFPIYTSLPDMQVLEAFVISVCAITGLPLDTSN